MEANWTAPSSKSSSPTSPSVAALAPHLPAASATAGQEDCGTGPIPALSPAHPDPSRAPHLEHRLAHVLEHALARRLRTEGVALGEGIGSGEEEGGMEGIVGGEGLGDEVEEDHRLGTVDTVPTSTTLARVLPSAVEMQEDTAHLPGDAHPVILGEVTAALTVLLVAAEGGCPDPGQGVILLGRAVRGLGPGRSRAQGQGRCRTIRGPVGARRDQLVVEGVGSEVQAGTISETVVRGLRELCDTDGLLCSTPEMYNLLFKSYSLLSRTCFEPAVLRLSFIASLPQKMRYIQMYIVKSRSNIRCPGESSRWISSRHPLGMDCRKSGQFSYTEASRQFTYS